MFAVGQMVYHRSGNLSGRVMELDGDTVYLLQANGFPEGTTPLKNDAAMKAVVIVK